MNIGNILFLHADAAGDKISILIDADLDVMARQSIKTIFVIDKGHMSEFWNVDLEREASEYDKYVREKMDGLLNFWLQCDT